jgi:glycosyltransferase involved in cell wall biosynthesis
LAIEIGEKMKKISFIIINYNDKVRVGRAIESCLNQTWKDKEIILVDDGSDAETREEYKRFEGQIKLIQLERTDEKERNPSRPRNAGIHAATGEYICFLDSDNYFAESFAEDMLKDIQEVSFCDWEIIGKQQYKVVMQDKWDFSKDVALNYIQRTHMDHQCLVIMKDLVDKIGGYDERFARSQDCDLLVRLMKVATKWNYVGGKSLFFFEKHETEQMKSTASIYGKTLWFLKNDLNIMMLIQGYLSDPMKAMSFYQAINDFETDDIWADDYNRSIWKKLRIEHSDKLYSEWRE